MDESPQIPRVVELFRSSSLKKCQELSLVLRAVDIEHEVRQAGALAFILVREEDVPRAVEELVGYDRENRGWPPRAERLWRATDWITATVVYAGALIVVYALAYVHAFGFDWLGAGAARSDAIRRGELWRAVTALSLHGSFTHLAGNLLFGGFFGAVLAQSLGSGLAWAAILAAGALANLANAWIQGGEFASIGASTAVMAALGMQVAWQWRMRKKLVLPPWKRWAVLIAGLVLFGMVGISDPKDVEPWMRRATPQIDFMGHALGFASGAAIGWLLAHGPRGVEAGPRAQAALGAGALLVLAGAWACALLVAH